MITIDYGGGGGGGGGLDVDYVIKILIFLLSRIITIWQFKKIQIPLNFTLIVIQFRNW